MIKTFFYLKTDKQNSEGESPIYAKIKLQGKSTTLCTGKFISRERWEFTNKLRNRLRLKNEMNCKLAIDLLENKIESIYFELIRHKPNTALSDVKNTLSGKSSKAGEYNVIKLFKIHNEYFKKKSEAGERSKASLQKYNRAKDLLANFIKIKHGKTSFDINEIDNGFIYNLESFLKYDSSFNSKVGISHNSVVKYFQCFKTVCIYGIKRNIITINPFLCYDEKLVIKDWICK
jgi:hypothetical protein